MAASAPPPAAGRQFGRASPRTTSAMRPRSASPTLLSVLHLMFSLSALLFLTPAESFPPSAQLHVVCKDADSKVCVTWSVDFESATKLASQFYRPANIDHCGLSDLKLIPPHRKFIAVNLFSDKSARFFCNTIKLQTGVPVIPLVHLIPEIIRKRRQTNYRVRGRYRGQTQSQYLSIDRGNGKDEGKAEAHSAADSSRAIVSGNSGMGQAQSQTIYDPSCEDCNGRSETELASLTRGSKNPANSQGSNNPNINNNYNRQSQIPDTSFHSSNTDGPGLNVPGEGQNINRQNLPQFNTNQQNPLDNNYLANQPKGADGSPQHGTQPGQRGVDGLLNNGYTRNPDGSISPNQNTPPQNIIGPGGFDSNFSNRPSITNQQQPPNANNQWTNKPPNGNVDMSRIPVDVYGSGGVVPTNILNGHQQTPNNVYSHHTVIPNGGVYTNQNTLSPNSLPTQSLTPKGNTFTSYPGSVGGSGSPNINNQGTPFNWSILSDILRQRGAGSTYFCCVVSPDNNIQYGGSGQTPTGQYGGSGQIPPAQYGGAGQPSTGQYGETGRNPTGTHGGTGQLPTGQDGGISQRPSGQYGGTGQIPPAQYGGTGQAYPGEYGGTGQTPTRIHGGTGQTLTGIYGGPGLTPTGQYGGIGQSPPAQYGGTSQPPTQQYGGTGQAPTSIHEGPGQTPTGQYGGIGPTPTGQPTPGQYGGTSQGPTNTYGGQNPNGQFGGIGPISTDQYRGTAHPPTGQYGGTGQAPTGPFRGTGQTQTGQFEGTGLSPSGQVGGTGQTPPGQYSGTGQAPTGPSVGTGLGPTGSYSETGQIPQTQYGPTDQPSSGQYGGTGQTPVGPYGGTGQTPSGQIGGIGPIPNGQYGGTGLNPIGQYDSTGKISAGQYGRPGQGTLGSYEGTGQSPTGPMGGAGQIPTGPYGGQGQTPTGPYSGQGQTPTGQFGASVQTLTPGQYGGIGQGPGNLQSSTGPYVGTGQTPNGSQGVNGQTLNGPYGGTGQTPNGPYGGTGPTSTGSYGSTGQTSNGPYGGTVQTSSGPYGGTGQIPNGLFGVTGQSPTGPYGGTGQTPNGPYGGMSQTPNGSYGGTSQTLNAPYGGSGQAPNGPYGSTVQTPNGLYEGTAQTPNGPYGGAGQNPNGPYEGTGQIHNGPIEGTGQTPNGPGGTGTNPNGPFGGTGQTPNGPYGGTGQTPHVPLRGQVTEQQTGVINGGKGLNNQGNGDLNNDLGGSGEPQNVVDPNSISSFDDYDSEAQASVAQAVNGTTALASSKGGNEKGRAQTQVEGTYSGTGSFSANAEISDDNKAAQSHVSGSKKGASSSAEGKGRKNKSQASVKLGSETGSILTDSQSSGDMHLSSSQVQGSVKGGMADAQAKGPGSTSSQAQIGFTPYTEVDKEKHDILKDPFEGSGTASAQSSRRMGTSQSQLRGTFKYGISYNGAAQAGSSLDKDAVFSNLLPFDKIDVFNENNKNINIEVTTTEKSLDVTLSKTEYYDQNTSTQRTVNEYNDKTENELTQNTENDFSDHQHLDHHKSDNQVNATTRAPLMGNRRSFQTNYANTGSDYEYPTDRDDPPEEYEIDDGFGSDGNDNAPVEQGEYANYDDISRDTETTHQSLQSTNKKPYEIKQTTGGNTQHIILGSLNNHDAKIIQRNSEHPDETRVYQPGEKVPGMGGYTIPAGFTGSVKSVASKDKTFVVGSKYSPSQAQTVNIAPGTGKIKYYPNNYGKNVNPKELRSLHHPKSDNNRYISVSKSVTRDLDSESNIRKQYSHTYYTKSSSCGYFTFTCTMVSSAEGKKKVCKPKIPTNPDGTPMRC